MASANGHLDIVKCLLTYGADINAKDSCALELAAKNEHLDIVAYLLKEKADTRGLLQEFKILLDNNPLLLHDDIYNPKIQLILCYLHTQFDSFSSNRYTYNKYYIEYNEEVKSYRWNDEIVSYTPFHGIEPEKIHGTDVYRKKINPQEHALAQLKEDFLSIERSSRTIMDLIHHKDVRGVMKHLNEITKDHIPALLSLNYSSSLYHFEKQFGSFLDYVLRFHLTTKEKVRQYGIGIFDTMLLNIEYQKLRIDYINIPNEEGKTIADIAQCRPELKELSTLLQRLLASTKKKERSGILEFINDPQNTHNSLFILETGVLIRHLYDYYKDKLGLDDKQKVSILFHQMLSELNDLQSTENNDKLSMAQKVFELAEIRNDTYNRADLLDRDIKNIESHGVMSIVNKMIPKNISEIILPSCAEDITIQKVFVMYYHAITDQEMLIADDVNYKANRIKFFEDIASMSDDGDGHVKCTTGVWNDLPLIVVGLVKEQEVELTVKRDINNRVNDIIVQRIKQQIANIKKSADNIFIRFINYNSISERILELQLVLYQWSQIGYSGSIMQALSDHQIVDNSLFSDIRLYIRSKIKTYKYMTSDQKKEADIFINNMLQASIKMVLSHLFYVFYYL